MTRPASTSTERWNAAVETDTFDSRAASERESPRSPSMRRMPRRVGHEMARAMATIFSMLSL